MSVNYRIVDIIDVFPKSMQKIVVITGLPLSGKSSLIKYASAKYHFPHYETGTFVFEEVRKRNLELISENIRKVSTECKEESDAYFSQRAVESMKQDHPDAPGFILSGIRSVTEISFLINDFGRKNALFLGVAASRRTRFARLRGRVSEEANAQQSAEVDAKKSEDQDLLNYETFLERDNKELLFGVADVLALSDVFIVNDNLTWPFNNLEENTEKVFEIIDLWLNGDISTEVDI